MTRIAVVEDDESIQKLITYALTANGYEARGFSDGQTFLDDAEKFEPALVLLDVMMPGIDGLQVLRCLRRSAKFAEIPVMMLTAKSAEAISAGRPWFGQQLSRRAEALRELCPPRPRSL